MKGTGSADGATAGVDGGDYAGVQVELPPGVQYDQEQAANFYSWVSLGSKNLSDPFSA